MHFSGKQKNNLNFLKIYLINSKMSQIVLVTGGSETLSKVIFQK
jgi:hypothetical protein